MSENEVWEYKEVRVYIGDRKVFEGEEVTAEKMMELAREEGIKKFVVETESGERLTRQDFPIREGTLYIREYNVPK